MTEISVVQDGPEVPSGKERDGAAAHVLELESLPRQERDLLRQAQREFEAGTTSPKLLERAVAESAEGDREEMGRRYVFLRFEELRQQRAALQRRVAARHVRQKISRPPGRGGKVIEGERVNPGAAKPAYVPILIGLGIALLMAVAIGFAVKMVG